jgi:hypothetical protein
MRVKGHYDNGTIAQILGRSAGGTNYLLMAEVKTVKIAYRQTTVFETVANLVKFIYNLHFNALPNS